MKEKNIEKVAPSSKTFFKNGMNGHSAVRCITDLGNNMYLINRTDNKPDIKVLVADIYIAGEADILEISSNLHDIDCIVLIGFYNRYSNEAKKLAKSMNVGLFNYREFFGAIHYSGNAFIDYTQKER